MMAENPQYTANGYNGKVYNKLKAPTSVFAWRIKFPDETPLGIIPEENFYITNSENVIFDFLIRIEKSTNSVIITPEDVYDTNVYYFLHIKKFKHGIGKNEKRLPPIHVGFKILDNDKLDLIWLKGAFNPENVMDRASRVHEKRATGLKQEYLGRIDFKYNIALLKVSILINLLIAFGFGIVTDFVELAQDTASYIIIAVCAVTIMGYIIQLIIFCAEYRGSKRQSVEIYNAGIANFNIGNYQSAENYFSSAILADPNNEKAELAIELNRKYLMKDMLKLQRGEVFMERMSFLRNNTLLAGTGVMGLLYCVMEVLNEISWITEANAAVIEYLKIFFAIMLVLHFIFVFIQSKSYEQKSVDAYNNGVEFFENSDLNEALKNFRLSLKYNNKNLRANAAKELTTFIMIKEQQKQEKEEQEAADKARKEEADKKLEQVKIGDKI